MKDKSIWQKKSFFNEVNSDYTRILQVSVVDRAPEFSHMTFSLKLLTFILNLTVDKNILFYCFRNFKKRPIHAWSSSNYSISGALLWNSADFHTHKSMMFCQIDLSLSQTFHSWSEAFTGTHCSAPLPHGLNLSIWPQKVTDEHVSQCFDLQWPCPLLIIPSKALGCFLDSFTTYR